MSLQTTRRSIPLLGAIILFALGATAQARDDQRTPLRIIAEAAPSASYRPLVDRKGRILQPELDLSALASASPNQFLAYSSVQSHAVLAESGAGTSISNVLPAPLIDPSKEDETPPPENPVLETITATYTLSTPAIPSFDESGWRDWIEALTPSMQRLFRPFLTGGYGTLLAKYMGPTEEFMETLWRNFYNWIARQGGPLAWVMKQALGLQPAFVYVSPTGYKIPVYETFRDPARQLRPADFEEIRGFLDGIPEEHRHSVPAIVSLPSEALYNGHSGFAYFDLGIGIDDPKRLDPEYFQIVVSHEVGHMVQVQLDEDARALWRQLSETSSPGWDCITTHQYDSWDAAHPLDPTFKPYGATNELEDFATIYQAWTEDSGASPSAGDSATSHSLIEEAARRAEAGHSRLLEKTLMMAAVFSDPATNEISFYRPNPDKPSSFSNLLRQPIRHEGNTLWLGDMALSLVEGRIVSLSIPEPRNGTKTYTFTTPIDLPFWASARWGL